ncbi:MAG: DUF4127 family protein [Dysgonamonadaceae bacterium]
MKRKIILTFIILISFAHIGFAQKSRILLIPLDDRPSSWQFPSHMANIANAEVTYPPMEYLGHFFTPGDSDKLQDWVRSQNLNQFDAAIVVVDMVAYSGLIGSRAYNVDEKTSIARIELIKEIREKAPNIKIYAQNVIMRLALTYNNENAKYYSQFSKWATIAGDKSAENKIMMDELEKEIPENVIHDYLLTRKRNLKVNLLSLEMVKDGTIDFLVLSQDDASPQGIHMQDQKRLSKEIERSKLSEKAIILPGADEVVMLLLARSLNEKYNQNTNVKAIYSSLDQSEQVMPFQDTKLSETVSQHIFAAGAKETTAKEDADVYLYVFSSRNIPGVAEPFANQIQEQIKLEKNVIVADVDPIGNIQGGDEQFTTMLLEKDILSKLAGYASWNTAGNTIGTSLPQGLIFTLTKNHLFSTPESINKALTAQNWFLLHRLMDDYYYHTIVRRDLNNYLQNQGQSSSIMNNKTTDKAQLFGMKSMQKYFKKSLKYFSKNQPAYLNKRVKCEKTDSLFFELPWNRTFEAKINFGMECTVIDK